MSQKNKNKRRETILQKHIYIFEENYKKTTFYSPQIHLSDCENVRFLIFIYLLSFLNTF